MVEISLPIPHCTNHIMKSETLPPQEPKTTIQVIDLKTPLLDAQAK